ncbi:MAG: type I DNA topoisomerase [Elusimicrobia bacterium]|nr:type I DNA topoisomerase [Elusimicrobiota bacterium]
MKLVIVESPNKVRKIKDFLGAGYRVAASFGHVRDLPVKGDLAVAFQDGKVAPTYEALERSARAVGELAKLAGQAEEVLLATDPDREGEAIAWHVTQLLGRRAYRRVVFNAVTKDAVLKALAAPRELDLRLVNAQQARRVLDRVVGWLVSPTLRRLGKQARSAGRVQSVALRLVAQREREIGKFSNVDYLILAARLERPGSPPPFNARLVTWKGHPLGQRLRDAALAEAAIAWCRAQRWEVAGCERRQALRNPPPPFTTATIQQAASVRLGLNPDATMKLLQGLFENGHITYHRTDSTALAPEAVAAARALIAKQFPAEYLPPEPIVHATKAANAQEAHEAIRPTHPEKGPDLLKGEEGGLYKLVWQRFVACQMAPGRDSHTVIDVACAPGEWKMPDGRLEPRGVFQARGKTTLFDGWRRLAGEDATEEAKSKRKPAPGGEASEGADDEDDSGELPLLSAGDEVKVLGLEARKRSTKPPPRYTQAALIKKLEKDGIGRPSTYANIMRTIIERGYVEEQKRKLHATALGLSVTDFLVRHFAGNFIELGYTARLEDDLDRISRGEADWEQVVTEASFAVLKLARAAGLRGDPLRTSVPR